MKFHKKVFVSKEMSQKREEILVAINLKKLNFSIHVITIPPGKYQLEIFPIGLNVQPAFDVENHIIVGIASSHSGSFELMEKLTQVVYDEMGTLDFKGYFSI